MLPHLFFFKLSLHPCLVPIQLPGFAWLEACLFPQGAGASGSRQQLPLGLLSHPFHWNRRTAGFGHGISTGEWPWEELTRPDWVWRWEVRWLLDFPFLFFNFLKPGPLSLTPR